MRAVTTQGREIDLKQERFNGFKMRIRGPAFMPGDAGYEESRTVWNDMIDRKPAVVARCLGIHRTCSARTGTSFRLRNESQPDNRLRRMAFGHSNAGCTRTKNGG